MPDENTAQPNSIGPVEALAITFVKDVGGQPAVLANLTYSNLIANVNLSQQNAVANQQSMNELGIAITAKSVNSIANVFPPNLAGQGNEHPQ